MKLKISSRQSDLARIQAYAVGKKLESEGHSVEYFFRESLGDQNQLDPLWKMPAKGVFTEDFYQDLVEDKTDIVVHSWKDLPTEEKTQTEIVASLERADQRDLLLFKKNSQGKLKLNFFSSSPRRTYNLKNFFSWSLPWTAEKIDFQVVRGNVPTRIRKLLEDPEVDGLIVAKAALDRLLESQNFIQTKEFLCQALNQLNWMVLPLSENPNAAAQGALALEIRKKRPELKFVLEKINSLESFQSAHRERKILQSFGGGCHSALGISVLLRPYGDIEIIRGVDPQGKDLALKKFFPKRSSPSKVSRLEFATARENIRDVALHADAVFVARAEAWPKGTTYKGVVWTAGMQTWRKLAAEGVWVHGSAEGLGEQESERCDILLKGVLGRKAKWLRLTHSESWDFIDRPRLATYNLKRHMISQALPDVEAFSWRSASEFLLALEHFPDLRQRQHICGPGHSYDVVKKELGSENNIFVELGDEFITVV